MSIEHIESSETITFPIRIVNLFWGQVDKDGPIPPRCTELGHCWIWTGCRYDGYGMFRPGSSRKGALLQGAHRFSWQITFGNIPDNLLVCHHCDNPPCVNPSHLFTGTNNDNVRDRDKKGRGKNAYYPRTPFNVQTTLTPEQVSEIRATYRHGRKPSQREIAERFSVSPQSISNIILNKTWVKILA